MQSGVRFSRRAVLGLVAAFALPMLLGAPSAAARKFPNVIGRWDGNLNVSGGSPVPLQFYVQEENLNNGKFQGLAVTPGAEDPCTGKITRQRKVNSTFDAQLNGNPVKVTLAVTVNRALRRATGTFKIKNASGAIVARGNVALVKDQS